MAAKDKAAVPQQPALDASRVMSPLVEASYFATTNAVTKLAFSPLDRMKFLLQCEPEMNKQGRLTAYGTRPVVNGDFVELGRRLIEMDGWKGMWRGGGVAAGTAVTAPFVNVLIARPFHNFLTKWVFPPPHPQTSPFLFISVNMINAYVAGALSALLIYPLEVARFALSCDLKPFEYANLRDFASCVEKGLYAPTVGSNFLEMDHPFWVNWAKYHVLYRGLMISAAGQMLYRGIFFAIYETVGKLLGDNVVLPAWAEVGFSYGMTTMAMTIMYPIDTIRHRFMRDALFVHRTSMGGAVYNGAQDAVRRIYLSDGIRGMYRGATFMLVRGFVTTAAAFLMPRVLPVFGVQRN